MNMFTSRSIADQPSFENETKGKRRTMALDLLRILACVSVCFEHLMIESGFIEMPKNSVTFTDLPIECYLWFFLEFGPPLFFMVSGSLMLPLRHSPGDFLKKRFLRIGVPMIIWSVFYLIFAAQFNTPERYRLLIVQAPFYPSFFDTFWFLWTLWGLYVLSPILSRWLERCGRRELEWYLGLWVFTSLIPYTTYVNGLTTDDISPFYYFSGYVGFYIAGHYLRKYHSNISVKRALILFAIYLATEAAMPWIEAYAGIPLTGEYETSFGSVLRAVSIYLLVFALVGKLQTPRWLKMISGLTFGVYLFNGLAMYFIGRLTLIPDASPWLRLLVLGTIATGGSFLVIWFCSFIPGSKWIVAYHSSRK